MAVLCLQEIQGGRREYHGKDEVLASKHEDKVHVQCVNGPCKMLTFEEYLEQRANNEEEMFYTREFYDAATATVVVGHYYVLLIILFFDDSDVLPIWFPSSFSRT